jgi:DNA modification methylase
MSTKSKQPAFSEKLNNLSAKEWHKLTKSVWNTKDIKTPPRNNFQKEHGATFPITLAERIITIYTKEGDWVLDPFAGTGTTLVAAQKLGRNSIGIELYEKFAEMARQQIENSKNFLTLANNVEAKIIVDDCRNLLNWVSADTIQLVFTSPPYANFIWQYSDEKNKRKNYLMSIGKRTFSKPYGENPKDFGNLNYEEYLAEVSNLMNNLYKVVKPGGYNIWVVRDQRDTKNGRPFIPFHCDIAKVGQDNGFIFHDLIVWDQNDNKRLVLLGYPSVFYVNINHSFLVVLRKPK